METTNQTGPLLGTRVVPFGGGTVRVRELTLRQRFAFSEQAKQGRDHAILWLCSVACLDEPLKGKSIDELDETYQSEALAEVAKAALELSGLLDEATDGQEGKA